MIQELKCTQCFAGIDISNHVNGVVSCEYCGTRHFISDDWYERFTRLPERQKDYTVSSRGWAGSSYFG